MSIRLKRWIRGGACSSSVKRPRNLRVKRPRAKSFGSISTSIAGTGTVGRSRTFTAEREARQARRGLWAGQGSAVVGAAPSIRAPAVDANQTVYITRTGEKYHRAGCRHLARSQIPIALKDVTRHGPCSVCDPPVLRG